MHGLLDDYEFQRGEKDRTGQNYVPERLPCGKPVNLGDRRDQCCRTECPSLSDKEIEQCYDLHKYGHTRRHYRIFS